MSVGPDPGWHDRSVCAAMNLRTTLLGLVAIALVAAASTAGYLLGHSRTPDRSDAASARKLAFSTRAHRAEASTRRVARSKGIQAGLAEGRTSGKTAGERHGAGEGEAQAQAELAAQAEAAAEAERQAALEEVQERSANCGAPLFTNGYCPTDAEVEQENQAEALCGPGTAAGEAQAAKLGIQC
jgi:hypothetical protein